VTVFYKLIIKIKVVFNENSTTLFEKKSSAISN
jgi:hypothetical protein